jgi:hypothetical protein
VHFAHKPIQNQPLSDPKSRQTYSKMALFAKCTTCTLLNRYSKTCISNTQRFKTVHLRTPPIQNRPRNSSPPIQKRAPRAKTYSKSAFPESRTYSKAAIFSKQVFKSVQKTRRNSTGDYYPNGLQDSHQPKVMTLLPLAHSLP